MLTVLDHIPEGFVNSSAEDLHQILRGPTLIHLDGRRKEPLFVSCLLHGNEPTGLLAIQALLKKTQDQTLPRALSIFIGNVAAARENQRHLDQQPDYNRIWPCDDCSIGIQDDTPEHAMMKQIIEDMRERKVFASIDVHNNTGLNPHYGCINHLDQGSLHLATLFSRTVVFFTRPKGVQAMAFGNSCPAVTVECGKPDQPHGVAHALEFIETCLHLSQFPEHPVAAHDLDLFHTVATVSIPEHVSFGFGETSTNIQFVPDLDHLNFRELPPGTVLGQHDAQYPTSSLSVIDELGVDVTERFFTFDNEEIRTQRAVMPSMFTLDVDVIKQDCLGYLMERMDYGHLDTSAH